MFSLSNEARMGPEYHSLQGKEIHPCDMPCNNLAEPNTALTGKSGTPALNYIIPGDEGNESVGYGYNPKYGHKGKYYNTGDYYKDDE